MMDLRTSFPTCCFSPGGKWPAVESGIDRFGSARKPPHQIRREGAEPFQISADRDRIGQALTNLLLNAIKYSPHGGPIVVRQKTTGDQVTENERESPGD
jgi:signal transduction histidine kinase